MPDFSNGFLVAEIFSRYYDRDVEMHSFSNGIGMRCRRDNWRQLTRLFRRWGLEIQSGQIDDIMHGKGGSAAGFLEHIYTFLTKRTVQKPPPQPTTAQSPTAPMHVLPSKPRCLQTLLVRRNPKRSRALSQRISFWQCAKTPVSARYLA